MEKHRGGIYEFIFSMTPVWAYAILVPIVAEIYAGMSVKRWETCEDNKIGLLPSPGKAGEDSGIVRYCIIGNRFETH